MSTKPKTQAADICKCPANSPFLWQSNRTGPSFAMSLQRGLASSKASSGYVESQRAEGHDVGHIHGLGEKPVAERHKPAKFVAGLKGKKSGKTLEVA